MTEPKQLPEILTASRFYLSLSLDGTASADCYFLECRGFQQTQAPIEICEVTKVGGGSGQQIVSTKLPGNVKSGNITLRHGMTSSLDLWKWFKSIQAGQWGKQRKLISLSIYNQASQEMARFELTNAWPSSYKLTDVNARSTEIEIEELEVAFEQFERKK
ncbi:MAG: phage tail protein [Chamaesiphon sp.]|nr:phage tail protein [Chamaesiphon sp.]